MVPFCSAGHFIQKPTTTMFSWSQQGPKRTNSIASQYPGRRTHDNGGGGTSTTATVVEGSIRPPSSTLTRAQHLESYLQDGMLSRSTRKVSVSDDTTYDTVFQTTKGDTFILRVYVPLGSSFTSFCPAMTLAGVIVKHKWVEERTMKIIGFAAIENETTWKTSGLSLGQTVHAVVKHLQLNPPEIVEITDPGLQAIQPAGSAYHTKSGGAGGGSNNPTSSRSAPNSPKPPSYQAAASSNKNTLPKLPPAPDVPLPPIPRDFNVILDGKSNDELELLLTNELQFLVMVHELPVSQEISLIAISKAEETLKCADENLNYEHRLIAIRDEIQQLQTKLKDKISNFQTLEFQQDKLYSPPDRTKETIAKLRDAKKQSFEESETFAEEWVENGSPNVDSFVKDFLTKRKRHHVQAAKLEVLERQQQQQVQQPQRISTRRG